jgi:hypothetical protein
MDFGGKELSSEIGNNSFNVRAFGGISFDLVFIRLDLTGMYNFLDKNYGGSLGVRLQL